MLYWRLDLRVTRMPPNKTRKLMRNREKVKVVDALPGPKTDKPFSVPDAGSTAALLGLSVALVVLAQRKAAIIK